MITWRVPALVGVLGAGAIAVAGALGSTPWMWASLGLVCLAVAALALLDWLIAAPVGAIRLARAGATQVRLGESADVRLTVTNRSVRPLRGLVRDAWVPSAGAAEPYAHLVDIAPEASTEIVTTLTPTRRGERPAALPDQASVGVHVDPAIPSSPAA